KICWVVGSGGRLPVPLVVLVVSALQGGHRAGTQVLAHHVVDVLVGDQDVGLPQSLDGAQGQQAGVSGSGAEEGDVSGGASCRARGTGARCACGGGAQSARSPIRPAAPLASISSASVRPRCSAWASASRSDAGT